MRAFGTALVTVLSAWSAVAAPNPLKRRDATTTTTTTTTTDTVLTTSTALVTSTDIVHLTVTETAYVIEGPAPTGQVPLTTVEPGSECDNSDGSGSDAAATHMSAGYAGAGNGGNGNGNGASPTPTAASHYDDGPSPSDAYSSAFSSASAAATTLMPAQPTGVDPGSVGTLNPGSSGNLSFTPPGTDPATASEPYPFAEANVTYNYPTVILPHSNLISNVSCQPYGLSVTFNNSEAYQYVHSHWVVGKDGLLLITYSLHCNDADDGMHVYWLVHSLTFDDATMTVKVNATEIAVEDAYGAVEIIWGTIVPPGSSSNGSIPISGTPGGGSSSGGSSGNNGGSGTGSGGNGTGSGGSSSGNSTDPSSGGNSTDASQYCLNPPESYMGLPTAPCGDDFDIDLDDKIGYFGNFSDLDFDDIAPGLGTKSKRALPDKRLFGINLGGALKSFGNKIVGGAEKLGSGLKQGATLLVDGAKAGAGALANVASKVLPGGETKYDKTVGVSLKPKEQVDSVFGKGNSYLLYDASKETKDKAGSAAVQLYCVDCGVEGSASIHGVLGYTYVPPLPTKFIVSVEGSLSAAAYLGLHAEAQYKRSYKKTLLSIPVPDASISVANLVTIGAVLQLDAQADLELKAEGQLLVGAGIAIEDFKATLDLFGPTSGITPIEPKITRKFDASGQISASVGLGLPMELAVGLSIPRANIDKKVGLRSTPLVTGKVEVKASSDLSDTKDCNNGLSWQIGISESLDADILGDYKNLAKYEKPDLFSGCFQVPVSGGGGNGGSGGSTGTPPSTGGGSTGTPPSTGGGSTETPPSTGGGSTGTPPSTGGGSTGTPPAGGDQGGDQGDDGGDDQGNDGGDDDNQGGDDNGGDDGGDGGDGGDDGSDNGDGGDDGGDGGDDNDVARRSRSTLRRRWINFEKSKLLSRQDSTTNTTASGNATATDAEDDSTGSSVTSSNSTETATTTSSNSTSSDSGDDSDDDDDEGGYDDIDSGFGWKNRTGDLDEEDISYIALLDSSGKYCMANDDDGNFFLLPSSEANDWTYASYDGKVVAGDGYDYYFFYYPDEMETLGVSRFRMNDDDHFPTSADMISLAPINYDDDSSTPGVYVALDSALNAFYPMLCEIEGLGDKVFLVKDLTTGAAILQDPKLQPVITGGLTTQCVPLALFSDGAGY